MYLTQYNKNSILLACNLPFSNSETSTAVIPGSQITVQVGSRCWHHPHRGVLLARKMKGLWHQGGSNCISNEGLGGRAVCAWEGSLWRCERQTKSTEMQWWTNWGSAWVGKSGWTQSAGYGIGRLSPEWHKRKMGAEDCTLLISQEKLCYGWFAGLKLGFFYCRRISGSRGCWGWLLFSSEEL